MCNLLISLDAIYKGKKVLALCSGYREENHYDEDFLIVSSQAVCKENGMDGIDSHPGNSSGSHFNGECVKIQQQQKLLTIHVGNESPACPNECEADVPCEGIDEHRKMCLPTEISCSNNLHQKYQASHVKKECTRLKVDCQYCHITGDHQFIEGEHKEQCPKFPISCPNKCEIGCVPRDYLKEHMKKCPLELIQCKHRMVGSEERMAHKDQEKHNKENMEECLPFATDSPEKEQLACNLSRQELLHNNMITKFEPLETELIEKVAVGIDHSDEDCLISILERPFQHSAAIDDKGVYYLRI